jgi:hypothetical protein
MLRLKEFSLSDAGRVLTQIRAEVNQKQKVKNPKSSVRKSISFETRTRIQYDVSLNRTNFSTMLKNFDQDSQDSKSSSSS